MDLCSCDPKHAGTWHRHMGRPVPSGTSKVPSYHQSASASGSTSVSNNEVKAVIDQADRWLLVRCAGACSREKEAEDLSARDRRRRDEGR